MRPILKWLAVMMVGGLLASAHANELFEQANKDYEAGQFRAAAKGYEEMIQNEGARVGVLQNLGSAYYRLGDDGRAILAFERALLLNPSNPDLQANLKLAQDEAAVFPAAADTGWHVKLARFSALQWSQYALSAAVLLPLLAAAWVYLPKKIRWATLPLAGFSLLVLALSIYALRLRGEEETRGIVLANPTEVKISPFAKAETRGTLVAGREVKLAKEESEYVWIIGDAGAMEGWVKKDSLARIVPE